MIETNDRKIIARIGQATATYFLRSKRIILVADSGCFHHGEVALRELSKHVATHCLSGVAQGGKVVE